MWQHPQFLFLVMGVIIVLSSILSYSFGRRYIVDPQLVALAIIVLTATLLVLSFIITRSFERLAEAAKLKSEFMSIVSHQLRSPLSNLKWAIEFLMSGRGGKVAPSQTEYFQVLKENSSRMHDMVNELLMVSKIEEGGLEAAKEAFLLPALLEKVAKEFKPLLLASNIKLTIKGEKQIPMVMGDVSQIRHVVQNLLDNAIRYAWKDAKPVREDHNRENRIIIQYKKEGKMLKVQIQDNGVGIPKEDQRYIFEKFFRSGNVLRHETQGSGLGLYIAKSMVEKNKGKLEFSSKEQKGSTFWFTIPLQS